MAIKIEDSGTIPAITLDHIQFSNINIAISEKPPYRLAITAKCKLYGIDSDGKHYYDSNESHISIADINQYIMNLPTTQQPIAMNAMAKIQEGLGTLAEIDLGYKFVAYE
jgi:hypothetical protein